MAIAACGLFATADAAMAEGLHYSIGLFGAGSESPFDTADPDGIVAPDFSVEGESFSFGTSGLTYRFIDMAGVTVAARLAPRWVTADPTDVPGLERLDRKTAIEAGLSASYTFGSFVAEVEALKDVSDTHDGMAVTAALSTSFTLTDRLSIGARAGATWMDDNLATYSYGVRASEAGGGIAAYQVKASVIPSLGVQASFALTDNLSLVSGMQAEFLPKSVTNSPIVKRDTLLSAQLGLRYEF